MLLRRDGLTIYKMARKKLTSDVRLHLALVCLVSPCTLHIQYLGLEWNIQESRLFFI
jgi:hypothetical protein